MQHHTIVHRKPLQDGKIFQLLPMLLPSAPGVPLEANTDANSLEPEVSLCRKFLSTSGFEAFSAWPFFEYCSVNRRIQCRMLSP